MTIYTRADLETADLHILEGERHIVQQEELLTRLQVQGHPTKDAEELLAAFNSTQAGHHAHRAAIAAALESEGL